MIKTLTGRMATAIIICGVAGIAVTVWARQKPAPVPAHSYRFPTAELAALDWVVQERISDTNHPGDGVARVGRLHRWFQPKNDQEKRILQTVNRAGTQVLLYAVGGPEKPFHLNAMCNPLKGPILLTSGEAGNRPAKNAAPQPADCPSDTELMALAERMWNEPHAASGISSRSGRWKIEAVPVLASQKACVQCHTPSQSEYRPWTARLKPGPKQLALGDPVGVAFYCYASS